MTIEELKIGKKIEYVDKTTKKGGHDRTHVYNVINFVKVKDHNTNEWYEGVVYENSNNFYVKSLEVVLNEFKLHNE